MFATATNEGGAKFNFGPPLRGSVRSPHKKVKANLFWGALGQPLKKQPSGGWSKRLTWSSKTSVGHHVTHMCYRLAYRLEQLVNNCYVFVRSVQGGLFGPPRRTTFNHDCPPPNIWTAWTRLGWQLETKKKKENHPHENQFFYRYDHIL